MSCIDVIADLEDHLDLCEKEIERHTEDDGDGSVPLGLLEERDEAFRNLKALYRLCRCYNRECCEGQDAPDRQEGAPE